MFLKELKIENKHGIVRKILFQKGLNLIVDETLETDKEDKKTTGNNVGKTTILRLIDYCFGSDGKNIYIDPEFKHQENSKVKDFLINTEVELTLTLVDDLVDSKESIIIKRNFLKHKKKIQEINGESIINSVEFDLKLKQLIFDTEVRKPTLRQIISKNIRDEKNKLINIVKVLNPYTKTEEYEALFLFWLGINTDTHNQKEKLEKEKTKELSFQRQLKKDGELSLIEQQLELVNSKITELQEVKSNFNFNEKFEQQITKLNHVKSELSKILTRYSSLDMRKNLILESKSELESEKTNIDIERIEMLYSKASRLIPDLKVSFEDTIKFHNDLVNEKITYIEKELPSLNKELISITEQINYLRVVEKKLSQLLGKSSSIKEYDKNLVELNTLFEKKGNFEERKNYWIKSEERLSNINEELHIINTNIYSNDQIIQSRLTRFNKYFTNISNELYGEEYLLSTKKIDKGYDLIVTNLEGNSSTGKKKGQIAAFDFAYILFTESIGIKAIHFIMHDQLENMHKNQLSTILIDLASSINCQFILPIVRDKIPTNIEVDQYIRLKLSEKDKLFRI